MYIDLYGGVDSEEIFRFQFDPRIKKLSPKTFNIECV